VEQQDPKARGLPVGRLLSVPGRTGSRPAADQDVTAEALLASVSCTVLRAGSWLPVPTDWNLPGHAPLSYVALLCTGGSGEYRIGGENYRMRRGSLLLCPPGVWRAGWHDPADPLRLYSVHFQARLYGVLDLPAVHPLPVAYRPPPESHASMVSAAQRIIVELSRGAPGHVLAADGAGMELFALVWREAVAQGHPHPAAIPSLTRLAPVFRFIEEHHAQPLTLPRLAAVVGLEPAYFSAFFKRVVGMAPMRYLARYRLSRVRELLLMTELPIEAIAGRTGFSDAGYLSRVFRAAEGMPPGEYRRTQKSPITA